MSTMVATKAESTQKTEITPEELLAMSDGGHFELIDGELTERNASLLSSRVAVRLARRLDVHCEEHDLGWVVDAECGYACFPWKPDRIRRPDVSFIAAGRLPSLEERSEGYVTIPPDLAVDVVSPNDRVGELDEMVDEYLRAGVRLVWVVRPSARAVQVFRGGRSESWLWAADNLSGEDVLSGFRCRVDELFPPPSETEAPRATTSEAMSSSPG
jgi:Uma2 family endonuclease